ncbi:MAG: DUF1616 domain-containing protein [Fervidicoccaceae archaeon]
MRLDEEVFAVILAVTIVGSVLSVAMIIPRSSERFASLGLLGEDAKIGDYPREVFVGEKVKLNLYLANYMGYTALFMIQGKIGNGQIPINGTSLDVPPVLTKYIVLCNECNATIPVEVVFNEPWINQTLVFELYIFNSTLNEWNYTGIYVFLRLNVTSIGAW